MLKTEKAPTETLSLWHCPVSNRMSCMFGYSPDESGSHQDRPV